MTTASIGYFWGTQAFLIAVLLQLLSIAAGSPLPSVLLPILRRDGTIDRPEDQGGVHQSAEEGEHDLRLALALGCSLIGALVISTAIISLCLRHARRHARRHFRGSTVHVKPDLAVPKSLQQIQCAWCYISESGICKWCSGEAQDIDDGDDSDSGRNNGNLFIDAQQNGWRSVINLPDISPANIQRERSRGLAAGARRESRSRTRRQPRSRTRRAKTKSIIGGAMTPVGGSTGKRSFRPGGIYEVPKPPAVPKLPGRALVKRGKDHVIELIGLSTA